VVFWQCGQVVSINIRQRTLPRYSLTFSGFPPANWTTKSGDGRGIVWPLTDELAKSAKTANVVRRISNFQYTETLATGARLARLRHSTLMHFVVEILQDLVPDARAKFFLQAPQSQPHHVAMMQFRAYAIHPAELQPQLVQPVDVFRP
jgi:hypothetical protein